MMLYQMLYASTPWTANNPFQLYENIKKYPLQYNQQIYASDQMK